MSTLLKDTDVWVVYLTINKKDGSGATTYLLALDYWAPNALITTYGSDIYPLLASAPSISRAVGVIAGVKATAQIQIYGKTHFQEYGKGIADLLDLYEFENGIVKIYYYSKQANAAVSTLDSANLMQIMAVVNVDYNADSGIVNLQCAETWFKDKELTKRFNTTQFPNIDSNWIGEYGATIFGDANGLGVAVDAPIVNHAIESSKPTIYLHSGWTYTNAYNKQLTSVLVRNQHKDQDPTEWLTTSLVSASDAEVAYNGDATFADAGTTNTWARALGYYSRAIVHQPSTNARILSAVRIKTRAPGYYWCQNFDGTDDELKCKEITELGYGSSGYIAIQGWFYLNNKSTTQTLVSKYASATERDYRVYYDQPSDRFCAEFYDNTGTSIGLVTANNFGSPSAGTWYHVWAAYDSRYYGAIAPSISINSGAVNRVAKTGILGNSASGFRIGSRGNSGSSTEFLNGRALCVSISSDTASLYNSGTPLLWSQMTDAQRDRIDLHWDLVEYSGGCIDSVKKQELRRVGGIGSVPSPLPITMTVDDGEIQCNIYHAQYQTQGDTYTPLGGALRSVKIDSLDANLQAGSIYGDFQIDPPLTMSPSVKYFVEIEWTKIGERQRTFWCNYQSNAGKVHYARLNTATGNDEVPGKGWAKQTDVELALELYCVGTGPQGTAGWVSGTGGVDGYSSLQLRSKGVDLTTGATRLELNRGLEFKLRVSGLSDDGGGSYTGTPGALIKNPADIVRFLLDNGEVGLGLGGGFLDGSQFTGVVRPALTTIDLMVSAALNSTTSIEEFILKICRQSRTIFYKNKQGLLTMQFPIPITPTYAATFGEAYHRDDCLLLSFDDNDYSTVVNEFSHPYSEDVFNLSDDVAVVRRSEPEKFSGIVYLKSTTSSPSDTTRQTAITTSQTVYGKRGMYETFDLLDTATRAAKIMDYYADRYATLQKQVAIRIPMRKWYTTIDLFSNIFVSHTGIRDANGTAIPSKVHYLGTPITTYDLGIPVLTSSEGGVAAQVVEVREEGPFMTVIAETVSGF